MDTNCFVSAEEITTVVATTENGINRDMGDSCMLDVDQLNLYVGDGGVCDTELLTFYNERSCDP